MPIWLKLKNIYTTFQSSLSTKSNCGNLQQLHSIVDNFKQSYSKMGYIE